jgi:hypothetical protein
MTHKCFQFIKLKFLYDYKFRANLINLVANYFSTASENQGGFFKLEN